MKIVIDGKNIDTKEMLHSHIASGLDFPQWYGENLDALYDCLTDITEETEISLVNSEALHEKLGVYADAFEDVLRDAVYENEKIKLIFE